MDIYLTVHEAAELLRVKPQTLQKWISLRKIPSVAVGGRTLFHREEILEWLSKHRRQALR